MAAYGLVLPDHDLTANEFKELARRIGRAAFTPLFLRYFERVISSEATVEEQRRGLADIARWTGVEEDKKVDPNANLPVFNIIFGSAGAASASMVVEDVTPNAPPAPPPDPVDALADEAIAMIPPEMLGSFAAQMKEIAREDATPPAGSGQPPAAQEDAKPRRRANARERSQALQPAQAADAKASAVQDGVSIQRQEEMSAAFAAVASGATLEEDLASLDRLLGI